MPKTVCVLMSTYNGEKYIRDQIESILNQRCVRIRLLVRDDGSTDGTKSILNEYKSAGKIDILKSFCNVGPARSFMELVYASSEYDYYAFADQDDNWKSLKLMKAVEMLENETQPALYASNQIIFRSGKEEEFRFRQTPNYTLTGIICGNVLSGCTMVFNNELKKILIAHPPSDEILKMRMHDTWVASVAVLSGKVIYDKNSYIDYRIHESNVVGIEKKVSFKRFLRFVKQLYRHRGQCGRSKLAEELLKINSDLLENDVLYDFSTVKSRRWALLNNRKIKKDCPENRIIFIIKVFFGWI